MPFDSAFIGRTLQLGALNEALSAIEQRQPQAFEIAGPAGIGKTRLLAELGARADARGHVVLTGSGAEFEQDLPLWVFVDALEDYVEGLDPARLARLDRGVRAELADVLPSLADPSASAPAALHERYRMHRAMRALLEHLTATKPLVLVLDDFHWADPASADLLMALLRRPPAAGVLLVVAARPRQFPPRLAAALDRAHRDGTLARLELGALTRDEARELVGQHAEALYEESGGNPFYLEQLARAPGATAAGGDGEVELAGVDVPPMVVAALSEELALLAPASRRVLDAASVAGDPFEIDLAAAAAGLAEPDVLGGLDDLVALDFVRPTDMPRRFRFRHPIVRRAVYDAAPGGWRVAAHERIAELLADRGAPASARALHVERSARHGDDAALAVLRGAADDARSRAPATAARWFESALRLLRADADPRERVELLLGLAQTRAATGQFRRSYETLLQTLDAIPPDALAFRVEVLAWVARLEHLLGLHEQAHERLLRALGDVPDEVSHEGVSVLIELALDGLNRMDYESMRGWSARLLAVAEQVDDPLDRTAGIAAAARGLAFSGATAQARSARDRAAALVDELSDTQLARRLDAIVQLAGAELYLHRFDDASRHAQRALAVGRATGQGQFFPVVFAILGITWTMRGCLAEAVDPMDGAVEAARLSGNAQTISWSLYGRANVAFAAGDLERAIAAAQEAVDIGDDDGKPSHHVAYAALTLGQALVLTGRPEKALPLLERAGGGPDIELVAPSWRAYFLELLTRIRLALGDREGAARAAMLARRNAQSVDLPLASSLADRAAAELALDAGDAVAAAELALRSAAGADTVPTPVEAALSRTVAGRALTAAGDRERALAELQAAAATLDACGAERFRDAAELELRQLGHRIHRRSGAGASPSGGVESLTQRELEIARHIVDRRTNREIAEELFLSPKTVETHVRNIFGKLGAESRVEVARIVERADRATAAAR